MEEQIKRILLSTMLPMALLIAFLLVASAGYVSRYNQLAQNLSISSEFNLHFKDDLDVGMYYIAIFSEDTSHLSEVMALLTRRKTPSRNWRIILITRTAGRA